MAVKRTGQLRFVEALLPAGLGGSGRLDQLSALVAWDRFEALLSGLRDLGPGRPGYPPLVLFKALLLQSLYGLSDADLEAAVGDRLSFRRFVGLGLTEAVPDHTTLCRFRGQLIEEGLLDKLFGELDRQLDAAGLVLRRGTMLDATLIETGASALAAVRRSDADLARLEEELARMTAAHESGDLAAFVAADIAFHDVILAATGNVFVAAVFAPLAKVMRAKREQTSALVQIQRNALVQHRAVLEAIRAADADASRAAMADHIAQTAEDLRRYVLSGDGSSE